MLPKFESKTSNSAVSQFLAKKEWVTSSEVDQAPNTQPVPERR